MLLAGQPPVELHWLRVGHCVQVDAVARRGGRLRTVQFPSYAGVLRRTDRPDLGWSLFDTGYADHFLDATRRLPERLYRMLLPVTLPEHERLPRQLAAMDVDPAQVRRVVVSHFHGDHVAGLLDHPRARVVAGSAGAAQVRAASGVGAVRHGLLPSMLPADLDDRLDPVESFDRVDLAGPVPLTGWDVVGDRSLVAVELPGHMPGHLGLLVTTARGHQVLLAGDAAWSSRAITELRPPSRLARLAFDDWTAALGTLGALHRLHRAHPSLRVLPSHCADAARAWAAGT